MRPTAELLHNFTTAVEPLVDNPFTFGQLAEMSGLKPAALKSLLAAGARLAAGETVSGKTLAPGRVRAAIGSLRSGLLAASNRMLAASTALRSVSDALAPAPTKVKQTGGQYTTAIETVAEADQDGFGDFDGGGDYSDPNNPSHSVTL